jgi:O-antigen/teichoic acid export membrane protein
MPWVINIATNYLRFAASMVAVFFMTPYVIGKLGLEQFGLWSLIYSLVGLFGLMDFGLATAAVKYVAEATGTNNQQGRNQTLATLLLIYVVIAVLCMTLVMVLATPVSSSFELADDQQQMFAPVLWLLGLAVSLNFPASLFKASMSGAGRMHIVNIFDLVMVLVNVSLTFVLLEAGYGMMGLAISTAVTLLGTSVAMIPLAYRLIPGFSVHWGLVSRQRIRPLLSFSMCAFMANIALLVTLRLDPIAIKMFLPLSAVALYAIAAKISEYVFLLNKQFSNALMPLVSQLHGRGDSASIGKLMLDGTRLLLAFALPAIGLLFYYATEFIELWLGSEFAASAYLLRILLVALLPATLQLNAANVLGMTGQHRFLAHCMLGSALLNILASIAGVAIFGLQGAAFGTLLAVLVIEAGLILPRAYAFIGVSATHFLRQTLVPALPALVPMYSLAWLLDRYLGTDNLGILIFKLLLCALVYLATFAITALTPTERAVIASRLPLQIGTRRSA